MAELVSIQWCWTDSH